MKKGFILRVVAITLLLCVATGLALNAAAAAQYPSPTDNVYDEEGILSDSVLETIKSTNKTLYSKVRAKIAVCIIKTTGGTDVAEYSRKLFEEWKLTEGVLLVITTEDDTYFAVQSAGIKDTLTNVKLDEILQEFLEPDYEEGNIARGVQKTVNKLSSFLKTELAETTDGDSDSKDGDEEKKVTLGGVLLSILRIILWTAVILVVLFVIFFVVALFNDDAAELMQRYVFSHFTGAKTTGNRQNYYDERLYGNPRDARPTQGRGNNAPQRRPSSGRPQQYDRYRQGGARYDEEYYGANSVSRQNPQRPNKYNQYAQRYPQQQNQQQNQYNSDYDSTQQYSIPAGAQNNRRNARNNGGYPRNNNNYQS